MSKYFNLCVAALCVVLLVSCEKKSHVDVVESFPVEKAILGQPVAEFNKLTGVLSIKPAGEYTVCNLWKQDYFFSVLDAKYNVTGELCRRGNGPDEFLAPAYFGQCDGDGMWMLERQRSKFIRINIPKSLAQGNIVVEKSFDLSGYPELQPRNIFYISEDLLFGTNDDGLCQTFTLNTKTSEIKFNPHALDFPAGADAHNISQNMATLKPDGKKVAACFFSLPQIDIYSSSGERLKSVFYKEIVDPQLLDVLQPQDYYYQIFSTDEYIYALYGEDSDDKYIHVFDWKGGPVASFEIDSATDFYVTEDNRHLITLDFEAETDGVKLYNISF